ncbi:MAG: hydantoinase/oxoprolinase family protein, partial [Gammaproteobacteria bacterium]
MPGDTLRIGIDVGGTNTDAVVMSGREVLAAHKTQTTADVGSGVEAALAEVLRQAEAGSDRIGAVMIGTTHFTNAFVQARSLAQVGVVRLAAPATTSLPPFVDWPAALRRTVEGQSIVVSGGYNYDGSEIAAVNPGEIRRTIEAMKQAGIRTIAVSSVFAPVNDAQEQFVRGVIKELAPDISVTLSSEIGRIGLLERENAALMNAALAGMAGEVVDSFARSLAALALHCPFYVSQNDGTLMAPALAKRFPVLTFASGPTNSIRGGGFLSGIENGIVVDIGGTTTDVGVLVNGFPRESAIAVDVGGVRTNFRMPDVLSVGLGGGSRVRAEAGIVTIGPDSVGYRLRQEALVFGGSTLTATDIAVAAGKAQIGECSAVDGLDVAMVSGAVARMRVLLEDAIDRMKTSAQDVPVVLVGGGSILAHRDIRGASHIVVPPNAGVANAVGAAIAQVSGEIDQVVSYEREGRDVALERAKSAACARAVAAGAQADTVRIVDVEELPLQYLPGAAVRVHIKAVGELAT